MMPCGCDNVPEDYCEPGKNIFLLQVEMLIAIFKFMQCRLVSVRAKSIYCRKSNI